MKIETIILIILIIVILLVLVDRISKSNRNFHYHDYDKRKRRHKSDETQKIYPKKECSSCDDYLLLSTEDGGTSGYSVSRDDKGFPTIEADNIYEAFRGVGYEFAVDRLFQVFIGITAAKSELSKHLGAGGGNLESDIFTARYRPTNSEYQTSINNFKPRVKNMILGLLKGFKDRIDDVNGDITLRPIEILSIIGGAPIPQIDIYDYLTLFILLSFTASSTINGFQEQITASQALQGFVTAEGPIDGSQIFNDLFPRMPNDTIRVTTPVIKNPEPKNSPSNCKYKSHTSKSKYLTKAENGDIEKSQYDLSQIKFDAEVIKDALRNAGIQPATGSWGLVFDGKTSGSKSGKSTLFKSSQLALEFPSIGWSYTVKIQGYRKKDFISIINSYLLSGAPLATISNQMNMGYKLSTTSQVTYVYGRDALFDLNSNTILIDTKEIEILGNPSINIDIRRSPESAYVIDDTSIQGIAICVRTPLIGKESDFANVFDRFFATSFDEYFDIVPESEIFSQTTEFADSLGNIAVFNSCPWFQLPSSINRTLPQSNYVPGLNPVPLLSDYEIRTDLLDVNTPMGYYSNWNQIWSKEMEMVLTPNSRSTPFINRGTRLNNLIKDNMMNGVFDAYYRDFMIDVANTFSGDQAIKDSTRLPSGTSEGYELWAPLILKNIKASSSSNKSTTVSLLESYTGEFIEEETNDGIINSPDVSEAWLLIQVIQQELMYQIFSPIGYITQRPTALDLLPRETSRNRDEALLSILDTSNMFNINYHTYDWLSPMSAQDYIVDAVDYAFSILGSRPWGIGLRGNMIHESSLGPVPGYPILNRAFVVEFAEINDEVLTSKAVYPFGQSGFINSVGQPDVHYADQFEDYNNWILKQNFRVETYDCEQRGERNPRIKYEYTPHPKDL